MHACVRASGRACVRASGHAGISVRVSAGARAGGRVQHLWAGVCAGARERACTRSRAPVERQQQQGMYAYCSRAAARPRQPASGACAHGCVPVRTWAFWNLLRLISFWRSALRWASVGCSALFCFLPILATVWPRVLQPRSCTPLLAPRAPLPRRRQHNRLSCRSLAAAQRSAVFLFFFLVLSYNPRCVPCGKTNQAA